MNKENEKQTYVTGITPNVNYHDIQKIPTTPLHTRILDNLYIYNNIAYFIETNYSILSTSIYYVFFFFFKIVYVAQYILSLIADFSIPFILIATIVDYVLFLWRRLFRFATTIRRTKNERKVEWTWLNTFERRVTVVKCRKNALYRAIKNRYSTGFLLP